MDKHLIAVDAEELASQGLSSPLHTIDLTTQPITSTRIQLTPASARVVRGVVHDSQGNPLPLVWLAPDEQSKSIRTFPGTGEFVWSRVPSDARSLWVVAPGYWRRAVAVDFDRLDIELAREPETQSVSWGNGTITVPPESLAEIAGNRIVLRRGWLWGKGTGTFTITTPDVEIELSTGTFALESLLDAPSWLYIIDGQAKVTLLDSQAEIQVTSGQMVAFGFSVTRPFPVPLDNTAIRALHAEESIPVRIGTNPDQIARLQDELGRRGISFISLAILATALAIIMIGAIVLGNRKTRPT